MAARIFLGYDAAAPALADAMTTTFNGVFDSTTRVAHQLTCHARAFTPAGVPGVVGARRQIPLGHTRRCRPCRRLRDRRGPEPPTWHFLGHMGGSCFPEARSDGGLHRLVPVTRSSHREHPAEIILTAADYLQNLSWFPPPGAKKESCTPHGTSSLTSAVGASSSACTSGGGAAAYADGGGPGDRSSENQ